LQDVWLRFGSRTSQLPVDPAPTAHSLIPGRLERASVDTERKRARFFRPVQSAPIGQTERAFAAISHVSGSPTNDREVLLGGWSVMESEEKASLDQSTPTH
jgi:hypothetical protein